MSRLDYIEKLVFELQATGRQPTPEEVAEIQAFMTDMLKAFEPVIKAFAEVAERIATALLNWWQELPDTQKAYFTQISHASLATRKAFMQGQMVPMGPSINSTTIVDHYRNPGKSMGEALTAQEAQAYLRPRGMTEQ